MLNVEMNTYNDPTPDCRAVLTVCGHHLKVGSQYTPEYTRLSQGYEFEWIKKLWLASEITLYTTRAVVA